MLPLPSLAFDTAQVVYRIVDTDGQILRVDDFFTWATLPDLTAPNGAVLKGDIAARLAGSSLEAQYAQAGGNSATRAQKNFMLVKPMRCPPRTAKRGP